MQDLVSVTQIQSMKQDDKLPDINIALVQRLLESQFPQWAHLALEPVARMGWDNRTFRLGDEMSVRLPSADAYDPQTPKENQWLPFLSENLSIEIPRVLGIGHRSELFPRHWSVRQWIEGQSLDELNSFDQDSLIEPLVRFLNELHALDGTGGPTPTREDGFSGGSLALHSNEVEDAFLKVGNFIDVRSARTLWNEALASKYEKPPVWVHGDMSTVNLLFRDHQLSAVIDFGSMAVGDPAFDLKLAWTFFDKASRNRFKQLLNCDDGMWARGRGATLLKVVFPLMNDRKTPRQIKQCTELFAKILED
jgi:aminoglycoside phosphotransferase (APT) family kinase protein